MRMLRVGPQGSVDVSRSRLPAAWETYRRWPVVYESLVSVCEYCPLVTAGPPGLMAREWHDGAFGIVTDSRPRKTWAPPGGCVRRAAVERAARSLAGVRWPEGRLALILKPLSFGEQVVADPGRGWHRDQDAETDGPRPAGYGDADRPSCSLAKSFKWATSFLAAST
jgi:hypothetical protein